ncbi:serine/threonine-protein kinase [Microlunatus capsulatus]|uniref:non-specific serine/threonine protein kinase n=2 Tax=Microlunatus capsulatus TaxID=99117 RepID=A0ABS4ZBJ0_9ACTN|nr:serine/threonine-protein kinase [Microlunatus capsulatus]
MTMTSVGDPLVGQVLDGRYQITSRLARGGMATVYEAVDTRLTRTVAVKVMHVGLGDDAEFARKFDREARAAARLSHPCVVSVFDQGQAVLDGHTVRPYIVMEHVGGPTLRDVILREAPMAPARALEIFEPVLSALAAAHDAGLVHRDVKPENVLFSDRGQVKVADFGLAKAVSSQTSTATQGLLIGTVSYLPPELVLSGRADARSDVYSAGVVLFELLTGRKPHTGETPIQVAYAHVHNDVPAPSTVNRSGRIPPYLDALVTGATARDADHRPHDARVLLTQVRRVRAALRDGVVDDPELTQDLSVLRTQPVDADAEPTQLVSAPALPRPDETLPRADAPATAGPGPAHAEPVRPTAAFAPPPVVPVAPRPSAAERAAVQRERQARKRRRGWLAVLLVLLLTTLALLAGWYLTEGRFTTAPALTRMSRADAERVASQAGLDLRVDEAYSESVPSGAVISTQPGPGAKVVDGGQIDAVVSRGPERYPVPTLVGLSRAAAVAALTNARLSPGEVTEEWSASVPVGTVTAASSEPGARVKAETVVALTVSKGPKPVKIADWTGKPADDAVAALRKAGFAVAVSTANSDEVPADRVLSQSPAKGSGQKGDEVEVVRSLGPVLVTVPNVRAMGVRAAEKVMREAGFRTRVQAAAVNYIGVGFVVSTGPKIRSQAPKGSTITLYVV